MMKKIICKRPECDYEIPKKALYFCNILAIEKGYCSWACWVATEDMKAFNVLVVHSKKELEKLEAKAGEKC